MPIPRNATDALRLVFSRFHSRVSTTMRGGGSSGGPLRPPLVSTRTSTKPTCSLAFSTPESLSDWLRPRLPSESFASWGVKPGTKTVRNLWLEICHGETSLCHPDEEPHYPLLRTVHVASVRIRNPTGALLVESHQLMSDGTVRYRSKPLSEKMKPGEIVEEAVERAVAEELGVGGVRIRMDSYEVRVEDKVSISYPGLPARYVLHSVEAEVDGLPEQGAFSTEEVGEGCDDGKGEVGDGEVLYVKRHYWKWVFDGDPNPDVGIGDEEQESSSVAAA